MKKSIVFFVALTSFKSQAMDEERVFTKSDLKKATVLLSHSSLKDKMKGMEILQNATLSKNPDIQIESNKKIISKALHSFRFEHKQLKTIINDTAQKSVLFLNNTLSDPPKNYSDFNYKITKRLLYYYCFAKNYGYDIEQRPDRAFEEMSRLAKNKHPKALHFLYLSEGKRELLQQSAELGYKRALLEEGLFLKEEGKEEKSIEMIKLAASMDDVDAMHELAKWYEDNSYIREAKRFYKKASQKGDPSSQLALGALYCQEGHFYKAIKYFRLSAKQGDLSSLYNYALTLEKMENYTKAMKYYEKGHATGDSESTYSLCELLYELHANDQDVDKKNRADKLLLKLINTTNDSKALELYRFNNPTEDDYQI